MAVSKREACEKVISEMVLGVWTPLSELADKACYHKGRASRLEMSAYLKEAKAKGIVECRVVKRDREWRRIE